MPLPPLRLIHPTTPLRAEREEHHGIADTV